MQVVVRLTHSCRQSTELPQFATVFPLTVLIITLGLPFVRSFFHVCVDEGLSYFFIEIWFCIDTEIKVEKTFGVSKVLLQECICLVIRRDKGALFLFLYYRFMFLVLFCFDVIGFVGCF
jgi:hypothetical protein